MSYAIKIGTTSATWIHDAPTPEGCVRFDGVLTDTLVWGDDVQTLREPNETESLVAAKAARIAAIKTERDRRKFDGVYVGANRFHSDADSRTQQLGLVLLGAGVPPVEWKTLTPAGVPDVYITMTPTLAQHIFGATAARDIACFDHAKTLISAVNAAQTVEAVAAVDISTGWPE